MQEGKGYLNCDIVGLVRSANAGLIEAQEQLASLHYFGDGVFIEKSHERSIYWYMSAAENGSVVAQFLLGGFYEVGLDSLERDAKKAVYWYSSAARQHYPPSIYALGMCYLRGFGLLKDEVEAARHLMLASKNGDADAQYALALCYVNGIGLLPDACQALRWYAHAAEQGNHDAMYELVIHHLATKRKLTKKMDQLLHQAADLGNPRAIKLLERIHDQL